MTRESPASTCVRLQDGKWGNHHGMSVLLRAGEIASTWLTDLSCLRHYQLRGKAASEWLQRYAIPQPEDLFICSADPNEPNIVRSGISEYLLIDNLEGIISEKLEPLSGIPTGDTLLVKRCDLDLAIGGEFVDDILAELCALNLMEIENQFVFTRLAGVSVWMFKQKLPKGVYWRLGCDPSWGEYLFKTLANIVCEFDGNVIGLDDYREKIAR